MATCGYLCPACEGRGFTGEGEECNWCLVPGEKGENKGPEADIQGWISAVHEGPCCGDLGQGNPDNEDPVD